MKPPFASGRRTTFALPLRSPRSRACGPRSGCCPRHASFDGRIPGMASTGSRGMLRIHYTDDDGIAALRDVNVTIEPHEFAVPDVRDARRTERPANNRAGPVGFSEKAFGIMCRNDAEISTLAARHMKQAVVRWPQPPKRRIVAIPVVVTSAAATRRPRRRPRPRRRGARWRSGRRCTATGSSARSPHNARTTRATL